MSEGDVSLIHDEEQLRRMFQQTEDFAKKKEIRAHMYKLREERLRNLYSPEPTIERKGSEFSSTQSHVKSFADQTFQSMKSKEVRDAGSPPKEFTYRGQELQELSNAGWNVESENKTTDDGHTHVRTVQANIEGKYDVEGGQGQFAAIDRHKQATTEYHDDNTSLKRNESSSNTAAHEQVVRQSDDGSHFSSTTSSSTSQTKFQQVSSTKHETVPYSIKEDHTSQSAHNEDFSSTKQLSSQTNRNQETSSHVQTNYEQSLRSNNNIKDEGELVSRKVEYPDDSTKVIVETRCLSDGTRVTSTRREYRAPVVHTSRSEQYSQHARNETKTSSSEHRSEVKQSSSNNIQHVEDVNDRSIRNNFNVKDKNEHQQQHVETSAKATEHQNDNYEKVHHVHRETHQTTSDDSRRSDITKDIRDFNEDKNYSKNTQHETEHVIKTSQEQYAVEDCDKKNFHDQYQTTYQSDFAQKKISTDYSPTHQAWASTLRADTPTAGKPSTRASSPGSKMSSTSSLRSSISPDKYKKPSSRGGSPSKIDRQSPSKSSDRYSSTFSTNSVTETKDSRYEYDSSRSPSRKMPSPEKQTDNYRRRSSPSPDKRPNEYAYRPSASPERRTDFPVTKGSGDISSTKVGKPKDTTSPNKSQSRETTPTRPSASPDRHHSSQKPPVHPQDKQFSRASVSPDRKPGYMRSTAASQTRDQSNSPQTSPSRSYTSPDRKVQSSITETHESRTTSKTIDDNYRFIDEETKMYTRTDEDATSVTSNHTYDKFSETTTSTLRQSPMRESPDSRRSVSPILKTSRSPSPPKGPVTFTDQLHTSNTYKKETKNDRTRNSVSRESSPTKYDKSSVTKHDTKSKQSSSKGSTPISTKTSPRDTTSPLADKYRQTTDFISKEKDVEEFDKKTKNRSRTLVTPSTSPTRKPQNIDTAPSTGQSSPTTSVSEILYFSSPAQPQVNKEETNFQHYESYTETDDNTTTTKIERPASLKISRSPSPSKIPCRSPSPQKSSPVKENLPRKSSLKKPSKDTLKSPVEQPPSTFLVSPTDDSQYLSEHHIVKKDRPEKGDENEPEPKTKPPLERRETYEERCRKILGMMTDDRTESSSKLTTRNSCSPMRTTTKNSVTSSNTEKNDNLTESTQLINREKDVDFANKVTHSKSKTPSRDVMRSEQQINKTKSSTISKEYDSVITKTADQGAKRIRTPSPTKNVKSDIVIDTNTEFIMTEKEKEVLDKVQKSLRKLSPDRQSRSPSRERSTNKTTTSLQDLDIVSKDTIVETETIKSDTRNNVVRKTANDEINKTTTKVINKHSSPIRKIPVSLPKTDKSPEKARSMSPRKPISPIDRPSSPQVPKSISKTKEPICKKTSPVQSPSKTDKSIVDDKKTSTKQNSSNKTSMNKTITNARLIQSTSSKVKETVDTKREPSKNNKENLTPKKDTDSKVSRTASETSIKIKKPSPQRVRSKPEIQIHTSKITKQTINYIDGHKTPKSNLKEPQLKTKPKSATSLNMPTNQKEVIVDVEQAKSSRENSPDRICPTPVSMMEDVGTPRLPDEVREPDDEFRKRTHNTIHETESIVDDIVEICEEEELFTRKTDETHMSASDECLLSVTDKVSMFTTAMENAKNSKESTNTFKDTERRIHSNFTEDKLKTSDSVLSASEKVKESKFVSGKKDVAYEKGQRPIKTESCDNDMVYTDDYAKLNVNDKTQYFLESAKNSTETKISNSKKIERPDLKDVDESLRSDDCLLSVSDKVNKFVKTAEQFLNSSQTDEEKDRKVREQHEKILQIITNIENLEESDESKSEEKVVKNSEQRERLGSFAKETASSHAKTKDYTSPNLKTPEKAPIVKITTMRSSEAVKKAKALFENIASTTITDKTKENNKHTKLTDIGVITRSPKTDSTTVLHPSIEDFSKSDTYLSTDYVDSSRQTKKTHTKDTGSTHSPIPSDNKGRKSPSRLSTQSPDLVRSQSPKVNGAETVSKSVLSRYPVGQKTDVHSKSVEITRSQEKSTSFTSSTKALNVKDEQKVEDVEVSSRRGSGKFGVELRRTSIEKTTVNNERRRSSTDHHQPCIEDIFDLDLLEQMLEKVVGYEQRRRIRAQIRIAKKKLETGHVIQSNTYTKSVRQSISSARSPERSQSRTPVQKHTSPERQKPVTNGHSKEPITSTKPRSQSPEKRLAGTKTRSPTRHPSPEKKIRNPSPVKNSTSTNKPNRFNEYASAYMKKVGLNETDKKTENVVSTKKIIEVKKETIESTQNTSKDISVRSSSRDKIETPQVNGKRTPSPKRKVAAPQSKTQPDRIYQRSPSPDFKKRGSESAQKKETIIKTVYDIDKKIPAKQLLEEKPSWVTNRNLKKTTSETRTFSSKKVESEKKYRAPSPSKVITKPIDVITSSYGPGPLDADGRPLFGIKALRNGATNYQVRGTVVREEYHSHNGSAPSGSVSVTAYSSAPGEVAGLVRSQGGPAPPPAACLVTTTTRFGEGTGLTYNDVRTKEERASLDQFLETERKNSNVQIEDISEQFSERRSSHERRSQSRSSCERLDERSFQKEERRDERKNVRQSSVKSLTEKYIKNASETKAHERGGYPKAGLILRTGSSSSNVKENVQTEDTTHGDSSHYQTSSYTESHSHTGSPTVTHSTSRTVTTTRTAPVERSFLDSTTKVSGVQDILSRMKNADIVIEAGDTTEDSEARALLNKFLGATVLMAGMQNYVLEGQGQGRPLNKEPKSSSRTREVDLEQCWDERVLKQLLDECKDYEQRRRIRARLRALMAEQEACASAVRDAVSAAEGERTESDSAREEEEVTTVSSSVRRNSSEKTVSTSKTTTTSKVVETKAAPKPASPFAKFRQLEKQNSTSSPNSPSTPASPGSGQPYFKFTDPALQASALTIKERLLQWCRDKTRDYENVKLENFSTSWADGLAFCALMHHFLPDAFDYSALTPEKRRHNFTLAFKVADEKAGIYPLLDVDDMVAMRKPDWKCVFTYVQSIHRRFKDQE